MSEPDGEAETAQSAFSSIYFKASLFVLLSGFIFTLGQAIHLNSFIYLSTFTYIDFLLNAVLIAPFIFAILMAIVFINDFFIKPVTAFRQIILVSRISDRERKKFWLSLINSIAQFMQATAIPIILIATLLLVLNDPSIKHMVCLYLASIAAGLLLRFVLSRTEKYAIEKTPKQVENKNLSSLVGVRELLITGMLILFFGSMHIAIQDENSIDATLVMGDESKELEVNILTSNSNTIVAYRNKKIEIIPRSEIKLIRHESVYFNQTLQTTKP